MKLLSAQQVKSIQADRFCFIRERLKEERELSVHEFKESLSKELLANTQVDIVCLHLDIVSEIDILKESQEYLNETLRYSWFDYRFEQNLPKQVLDKIYTEPLLELYEQLLAGLGYVKIRKQRSRAHDRKYQRLSSWRLK